jgi:zinc protease
VRELIDLSMQVVDDLRQNGVSEEDLNQAKNYLLGSFPLRLETPEGEGSYLMMARRYGLGDDYLAAYPERVKAVTRTAVSMAASELLDTSRLRIIVVGPREALYDQLKDLGDVTASDWQDDSAIPPNP